MIGDRYDIDKWNCTHEVSQWYALKGYPNAVQPVSSADWDTKFVRWMRKHFTPIEKPEQACLVVMKNKFTGGLHIGVWDRGMVHHCFQPGTGGPGQTIRSPLSLLKLNHVILRYGKYNGENTLL
jgi:hypothetical protein